jgi:hypothetical protein
MGIISYCRESCSGHWEWCFHKIKSISSWFLAITLLVLLGILLFYKVEFNSDDWSLFFNSELPRLWIKLGVLLIVSVFVAGVMPGQTINKLTGLSDSSTSQDKWVALIFYLGVLYIAGQIIRGGV